MSARERRLDPLHLQPDKLKEKRRLTRKRRLDSLQPPVTFQLINFKLLRNFQL